METLILTGSRQFSNATVLRSQLGQKMLVLIDAERLRKFFSSLQSQQADSATSLGKFFSDFKRLDRRDQASSNKTSASPAIDQENLEKFIDALQPHAEELKHMHEDINIWRTAGLGRNEIRNAAVLAWILDSRQSHGFGPDVLNALLDDLRRRQRTRFPIPAVVDGPYHVGREFYSFGDGQSRVDLMIDTGNSVIAIEVKIGALERPDQVRNYIEVTRTRAVNLGKPNSCVIYLTRGRIQPKVVDPSLVLCDWTDVARAIRAVLSRDKPPSFTKQALYQLALHFDQI